MKGIAALSQDGTPAVGDEAFEELKRHWEPVFNGDGGEVSAMEKFRDLLPGARRALLRSLGKDSSISAQSGECLPLDLTASLILLGVLARKVLAGSCTAAI